MAGRNVSVPAERVTIAALPKIDRKSIEQEVDEELAAARNPIMVTHPFCGHYLNEPVDDNDELLLYNEIQLIDAARIMVVDKNCPEKRECLYEMRGNFWMPHS